MKSSDELVFMLTLTHSIDAGHSWAPVDRFGVYGFGRCCGTEPLRAPPTHAHCFSLASCDRPLVTSVCAAAHNLDRLGPSNKLHRNIQLQRWPGFSGKSSWAFMWRLNGVTVRSSSPSGWSGWEQQPSAAEGWSVLASDQLHHPLTDVPTNMSLKLGTNKREAFKMLYSRFQCIFSYAILSHPYIRMNRSIHLCRYPVVSLDVTSAQCSWLFSKWCDINLHYIIRGAWCWGPSPLTAYHFTDTKRDCLILFCVVAHHLHTTFDFAFWVF